MNMKKAIKLLLLGWFLAALRLTVQGQNGNFFVDYCVLSDADTQPTIYHLLSECRQARLNSLGLLRRSLSSRQVLDPHQTTALVNFAQSSLACLDGDFLPPNPTTCPSAVITGFDIQGGQIN
jgi:hypothetical protein